MMRWLRDDCGSVLFGLGDTGELSNRAAMGNELGSDVMGSLLWGSRPRLDVKKYFRPEPDITTYELAILVSNFSSVVGWPPRSGVYFTREMWDAMPANLKRHFQDEGYPEVPS